MNETVKVGRITRWKPGKTTTVVDQDGKLFICYFDKIFGIDKLSQYNIFIIKKDSYVNQLPNIIKYINFFENFYDKEERELPSGYLAIKFALDKNHIYDEESMSAYIDFIYLTLFSDSMVDKIYRMIEENYLDDIDYSEEGVSKKKYVKDNKKHLESLEFTNEHVKGLLRISMGMKIIAPCLFHYTQLNNIKIPKDSDIIFKFYHKLFDIFKYSNNYDLYGDDEILIKEGIKPEVFESEYKTKYDFDVIGEGKEARYYFVDPEDGRKKYITQGTMNLYNKLYVYVRTKILQSNTNNSIIFQQREIFGHDLYTIIETFVRRVLISESCVKYKMPSTWNPKLNQYVESVIGFNKTIIKFQLNFFLKEQYAKNVTEITSSKNSEGLSGSDKFLMNQQKLDEGVNILTDLNIKFTIRMLRKMFDIPITEEEIDYYCENQNPIDIQIRLVGLYYAKYFGSYHDLNVLRRREYVYLSLLLKKKLLLELGYNPYTKEVNYAMLPYILTGNVADKINTRVIRNNNFTSKMKENYMYNHLMNKRYHMLSYIKPEELQILFSSMINSVFTYVTYENQELLGTEIIYDENKIGDELAYFMYSN